MSTFVASLLTSQGHLTQSYSQDSYKRISSEKNSPELFFFSIPGKVNHTNSTLPILPILNMKTIPGVTATILRL